MIDRASIFSDSEIVETVKKAFVPAAIDVIPHQHRKDAEGDLYRGIATGAGQGIYAVRSDGKRIGYTNHRGVDRMKQFLSGVLAEFEPVETAVRKDDRKDTWWVRRPPEGGLVVNVTCKVLGGYEVSRDEWKRAAQIALGRDRLWIRGDEHQALVRGEMPASLAHRIARFHLIDITRGTPPFWKADEVKKVDLIFKEGKISGKAHLEAASGDRGYSAEIHGIVDVRDGKVTRFDLISRGEFSGEHQYTSGAPKGKYPFAVAFALASQAESADLVPPAANRKDPDEYLR